MLFNLKSVIVASAALVASVQAITVSTPASLITCQPVQLNWSGGSKAPYYLAILPGGQASAAALENLPQSNSSPTTWTVDIAAGTSVTIRVTDGDGNIAYSSPVTVQAGASTSCIGGSSASGSSSASSAAGSSASGSATGSASGSGTASASGSAAAATSSRSSALSSKVVGGGLIGAMGVVAAVLV